MAGQDQVPQDEDLLVEVVPDEVPAPEGVEAASEAAPAPAAAPKVVTAEEGVAELRAKLEARDRETAAAERRAKDAEAAAHRAGAEVSASRTSVIDSRIGQVDSALETMSGHIAETRRQYAAAAQAGDFEKMAELQEQMTENTVTMRQLKANKAQLEHAKKAPQPAPRPAPAPAQGGADPLEGFLRTLQPRDQAWLRARPEYVTDAAKNKRLVAAHHTALVDHEAGSDAYYAAIEKQLGITAAAPTASGEPPARRAPSVSAPPSRPNPSLSAAPVQQRTVRLTAAEVRMAEAQGMTAKEWAVEKEKHLAAKAAGAVTEH